MVKLLIGGSPCTYWTIARVATHSNVKREVINSGIGWELFDNYYIVKEKFNPDVYLYENVASMSNEIKQQITSLFGVEPYKMNGGNVSAAERERYFWTNTDNVTPLIDKGLVISDILEENVDEKYYYNYPLINVDMTKQICATLDFNNQEMHKRVFNPAFKCHTLTAVCGGGHHKKVLVNGRCRKFTPVEYERMMNMPDGYTDCVSDSHRYKSLGNGWTADVVIHILNKALENVLKDEEIVVLSMYDGIGTGRYCLDKMGFTNVKYYAYEIDKYAIKIAKSNYPDIIEMGDAFQVRNDEWKLNI